MPPLEEVFGLSEIIKALEEIAGSENVSTNVFDRISYSINGILSEGVGIEMEDQTSVPMAVVRPFNSQEVSAVLQLANKHRLPVTVRTRGTAIGGTIPQKPSSIVLDLSRMNWIKLFKEAGYVEVGPSVTNLQLNEFLAPHGYEYPIFPGSWRVAGWGGIISMNTSGHVVDAYHGKPGRYVLGLEVVLPTGEIMQTGTKALRGHVGLDLTRLFIGGEGMFGVITNIRLRLLPKPLERKGAWVIFESVYDMAKSVMQLFTEGGPYPRILEFMDEKYAKKIWAALNIKAPDGVLLLVETDGEAPGEAQWKMERIMEICRRQKVREVRIIEDKALWDEVWYKREIGIVPTPEQWGKQFLSEVIDPPIDKLLDVTKEVMNVQEKFSSKYGVETSLFGHIGGPSMHPQFIYPPDWDYKKVRELNREIRKDMLEVKLKYDAGVGEQGIFTEHRDWLRGVYGETYYDLIKRIKSVFDPNDILNPGRF